MTEHAKRVVREAPTSALIRALTMAWQDADLAFDGDLDRVELRKDLLGLRAYVERELDLRVPPRADRWMETAV